MFLKSQTFTRSWNLLLNRRRENTLPQANLQKTKTKPRRKWPLHDRVYSLPESCTSYSITKSPNGRRICVRPRIWSGSANGSARRTGSRSGRPIWRGCPRLRARCWIAGRPRRRLDGANGIPNETSCLSSWSLCRGRGSASPSGCERRRRRRGALGHDLDRALAWGGGGGEGGTTVLEELRLFVIQDSPNWMLHFYIEICGENTSPWY